MKEGGGAEGECERERALGVLLCYSLGQCLVLSAAFVRGNGVVRRTQKVIQGDDNRTRCCVCVYYGAHVCVYYCRTYDKAVCGGGGGQ